MTFHSTGSSDADLFAHLACFLNSNAVCSDDAVLYSWRAATLNFGTELLQALTAHEDANLAYLACLCPALLASMDMLFDSLKDAFQLQAPAPASTKLASAKPRQKGNAATSEIFSKLRETWTDSDIDARLRARGEDVDKLTPAKKKLRRWRLLHDLAADPALSPLFPTARGACARATSAPTAAAALTNATTVADTDATLSPAMRKLKLALARRAAETTEQAHASTPPPPEPALVPQPITIQLAAEFVPALSVLPPAIEAVCVHPEPSEVIASTTQNTPSADAAPTTLKRRRLTAQTAHGDDSQLQKPTQNATQAPAPAELAATAAERRSAELACRGVGDSDLVKKQRTGDAKSRTTNTEELFGSARATHLRRQLEQSRTKATTDKKKISTRRPRRHHSPMRPFPWLS